MESIWEQLNQLNEGQDLEDKFLKDIQHLKRNFDEYKNSLINN